MDRPTKQPGYGDSSKLRRTQSIASSKLRRTKSIAAVKPVADDSSMSSLGSLPEADMVAQQFANGKLSRQQTIAVDGPIISNSHRKEHRSRHRESRSHYQPPVHQKQCPHCLKEFSNSWAVPKHVQVCIYTF